VLKVAESFIGKLGNLINNFSFFRYPPRKKNSFAACKIKIKERAQVVGFVCFDF